MNAFHTTPNTTPAHVSSISNRERSLLLDNQSLGVANLLYRASDDHVALQHHRIDPGFGFDTPRTQGRCMWCSIHPESKSEFCTTFRSL